MKPLKMRYIGDPVLVTKAKEIPEITDEIRELSAEMIQTMYRNNGCGLAGNQIGKALRIAVIHVDPPEDKDGNPLPMETPGERELCPKMPITLINPEIVEYSEEQCTYEEGCLSVPKLYANVVRSEKVVLKATLLDGSKILLECGGFLARAIQHELDHLEGIVFVEKAETADYEKIRPALEKMIKKNGFKNFKVRRRV